MEAPQQWRPVFAWNALKKTWQPAAVLNRQQPTEGPWTYNMDILGKIYQRTREHLKQEWNHSLSQQYLSTHSTVHCREKAIGAMRWRVKECHWLTASALVEDMKKGNLIIWPNGKNINDKNLFVKRGSHEYKNYVYLHFYEPLVRTSLLETSICTVFLSQQFPILIHFFQLFPTKLKALPINPIILPCFPLMSKILIFKP